MPKNPATDQNERMRKYYEWQSKIYDATRWSFLFGRHKIIQVIPSIHEKDVSILEVGCGTGYNIEKLAKKYRTAKITGMDVSGDMISIAEKNLSAYRNRVTLIEAPYQKGAIDVPESLDVVLFSYSLTMINPQWSELILQAKADLKNGGVIAVVDFYDSRFKWFKNHMGNHHVRMDGHILPVLESEFDTFYKKVRPAYGGIWHYFLYVGKKYPSSSSVETNEAAREVLYDNA